MTIVVNANMKYNLSLKKQDLSMRSWLLLCVYNDCDVEDISEYEED